MNIELTKHWHYLISLIGLLLVSTIISNIMGDYGDAILSAITGFLMIILIVMWISFAKNTSRKNKGK